MKAIESQLWHEFSSFEARSGAGLVDSGSG